MCGGSMKLVPQKSFNRELDIRVNRQNYEMPSSLFNRSEERGVRIMIREAPYGVEWLLDGTSVP
jgi:hypothetical protein